MLEYLSSISSIVFFLFASEVTASPDESVHVPFSVPLSATTSIELVFSSVQAIVIIASLVPYSDSAFTHKNLFPMTSHPTPVFFVVTIENDCAPADGNESRL